MKKRLTAMVLTAAMVAGLAGCGSGAAAPATKAAAATTAAPKEAAATTAAPKTAAAAATTAAASPAASGEGKVFNIACWNDEFQSRVKDFYPGYKDNGDGTGKIGDVTVKWIITPNQDNAYQNALDEALLAQDSKSADEKIDMFLVEADYALKYVDSEYSLDVKKDIGLTDDDLKNQYQYTKDIVTDKNGAQKGSTWQATPGLYAYRRSIAKDVLGTDDPEKVQAALADWSKFDEVAAKASAKGYKMLSGYDDSYRTFSNNVAGPWVKDNKIVVDANLTKWVDQTKTYTEKSYNNKTSLWDDQWNKDQGPSGKVFGFFYSTWGINFTLLGNSLEKSIKDGGKEEVGNGCFGDYAVCKGPQPYYWGGTWICGAKRTDNKTLVKDIMKNLTCDGKIMKAITEKTQDYTNNKAAMEEIANSDFKSAFLGGQNHIKLFAEVAPTIDMSNISAYDQGLNEAFQKAFKDYFDGNVDKDTALSNFYKAAQEKYPELSH